MMRCPMGHPCASHAAGNGLHLLNLYNLTRDRSVGTGIRLQKRGLCLLSRRIDWLAMDRLRTDKYLIF